MGPARPIMRINKADLVVAIGARFSDRVALNPKRFASEAKIIQIDIDVSEVNKNVLVDAYLVGDVKQVLTDLIPMVEEKQHPEWVEQIKEWQRHDYHPKDSEEKTPSSPGYAYDQRDVREDTVYVTDVGQHQMWVLNFCTMFIPDHSSPAAVWEAWAMVTVPPSALKWQ